MIPELQNIKFHCGKTNFSDDGNSRPANLHFIRRKYDDFGGKARLVRCLALLYKHLFNVNSELQNVKFYYGKTNFSDDGKSRPANLHFINENNDDFSGKARLVRCLTWDL